MLTCGAGFAWLYGALPNHQSFPRLALEMALTVRAACSPDSRVDPIRLGSCRPIISPMRQERL